MSDSLELQLQETNYILSQRKLQKSFIHITETMGHSPQLVAFINRDSVFSNELGLESFNELSGEVQSEILLNHFKNNSLDDVALESLSHTLRSASKWFIGAGGVGLFAAATNIGEFPAEALILGGISIATILSGVFLNKVIAYKNRNQVLPYYETQKLMGLFNKFEAIDAEFSENIPDSLEYHEWSNFYDLDRTLQRKIGSIKKDAFVKTDYAHWKHKVDFDKSGWDAKKFQSVTKWIAKKYDHLSTIEKKYSQKMLLLSSLVEKYDSQYYERHDGTSQPDDIFELISSTVGDSLTSYMYTNNLLRNMRSVLNDVGKNIEIEK